MRKELKMVQVTKHKIVEELREVFITDDGKEFAKEDEAILHEKFSKIKTSKWLNCSLPDCGYWAYLENMGDLHTILAYYKFRVNEKKFNDSCFPSWFFIEESCQDYDYNGYTVRSLEELTNLVTNFVNSMPTTFKGE